jgi:2-polyprenyl-3-methyl-5-hydroxy-6-metoxy-1,4-benzoquinol methylase
MWNERVIKPELLDHAPPEEAKLNLEDLVRINRRFGGHSAVRAAVKKAAGADTQFSLLDIGAASGDTAVVVRDLYPGARVVSLDYSETNLQAAPAPKVIANAFALPFPPESFDFTLCSLFLHHFTSEQVIELIRSFYVVCRRALIVCDLERHILPYLFLPATRFLFGWRRLTLHDGPISVRAAFRAQELVDLAHAAGIEQVEIETHRPAFRHALVARKS